jgi:hypothetical protein
MQKIFDVNNKEDMDLLWSILPDEAYSIKKSVGCQTWRRKGEDTGYYFEFININWHDKTEITRPVNYEDMIGCVGWFWDCDTEIKTLGVLKRVTNYTKHPVEQREIEWNYFTPAKKSELKFYEDK